MPRDDISDSLIHFTKGETGDVAFNNLLQIISEGCLRGSSSLIRGGYDCVCFSEAPLETLRRGLVNPDYYSRYSPFGIMVNKTWLFEKGGRPVIYQPEEEFEELSKLHRWRHVRYEPLAEVPVDFTWEREWRINCEILPIYPEAASIVVPDEDTERAIIYYIAEIQRDELMLRGYDQEDAEMYIDPYRWQIVRPH